MTAGSNCASSVTASQIKSLVLDHPCANHEWFNYMRTEGKIDPQSLVNFLVNYDAHATLLRRLLLKAATIMPEPAVGFILENVRNEYGNGNYDNAHQKQLLDLVRILTEQFAPQSSRWDSKIESGVSQYMSEIQTFYYPEEEILDQFKSEHISAGAVTATELLALEEFKALREAFRHYGLERHIWFDHVNIEEHHADDSLSLVKYFLSAEPESYLAIEFGVGGVLMSNSALYSGFLSAVCVDTTCSQLEG